MFEDVSFIIFSLMTDILSVGGCWGQPMLSFWKMALVTKNSLSQGPSSNQIQHEYLYPSEPIHKCHFNMRYPVVLVHTWFKFFIISHSTARLNFWHHMTIKSMQNVFANFLLNYDVRNKIVMLALTTYQWAINKILH